MGRCFVGHALQYIRYWIIIIHPLLCYYHCIAVTADVALTAAVTAFCWGFLKMHWISCALLLFITLHIVINDHYKMILPSGPLASNPLKHQRSDPSKEEKEVPMTGIQEINKFPSKSVDAFVSWTEVFVLQQRPKPRTVSCTIIINFQGMVCECATGEVYLLLCFIRASSVCCPIVRLIGSVVDWFTSINRLVWWWSLGGGWTAAYQLSID